ncbi:hypothetical protein SSCG_04305 [Streptomyces clavuligerus]|nr:hypothetical protein SSCG_04305 [Streptomyces clavuligerus]
MCPPVRSADIAERGESRGLDLGRAEVDVWRLGNEVLALNQEAEEERGEARALEDLADLLDDPEAVRDCLRRALTVYEEGGSPRAAEVLARLTAG